MSQPYQVALAENADQLAVLAITRTALIRHSSNRLATSMMPLGFTATTGDAITSRAFILVPCRSHGRAMKKLISPKSASVR